MNSRDLAPPLGTLEKAVDVSESEFESDATLLCARACSAVQVKGYGLRKIIGHAVVLIE
jgi:hypothetical protein